MRFATASASGKPDVAPVISSVDGADVTISSLKPYASKLTLGGPPECPTFAGCEPGLKKVYGLNFAGFTSLDEAGPLSVAALKNNEVQVVELFSSDGNVVENKLTTNAISKLNLDVTSKQEQPAAVAQAWLSSVGG